MTTLPALDLWEIVPNVLTLVLTGWRFHKDLHYRRWLRKKLEEYDTHRKPVTVTGQDRELLERALGERKLEVTDDYLWCWEVVRPRLGPARGKR